MTKRVAVALSGGIDSAVTAVLLLEQGYDVVGITGKMTCSAEADEVVKNAKSVADKLGIEHFSVDVSKEFDESVIKYFEESYKAGKTPNPCIMCNKFIKWGVLFDYAINTLNVDYIATGHYARIINKDGYFKLYPASDEHKDQLYFLFSLDQDKLSKTLFPLSEYKKSEVRELAEKYDLPPKSAKESQDICFIKPPLTTKKYLNNLFKAQKGQFIEKLSGKVLGYHDGFWQFTIGQRKGIGIAYPEPLYVVEIDAQTNTVYVGCKNVLDTFSTKLNDVFWSYPMEKDTFEAYVKIRYNMQAVLARVCKNELEWIIDFQEAVSGITSGQACVFYDKDDKHMLGGGFLI